MEPLFQSERLLYRHFHRSDAHELALLLNDYDVYKTSLNLPYPFTADDGLRLITSGQEQREAYLVDSLAVVDKASGKLVGFLRLTYSYFHRHAELGYVIDRTFRGLGYGTEAVGASVSYLFSMKHFHRVYCRQLGRNPASEKIMEKVGFTREGVLVRHFFKIDRYVDVTVYGLNCSSKDAVMPRDKALRPPTIS
ncbi:MAG: GNAT family N-acetyltransferase [Clostridiales bacterium]|jgi:RimJ/RimL family protein N-acetyltransferase|nr:GNAT family N-acetyltransferase [Clostridiales bacterium]